MMAIMAAEIKINPMTDSNIVATRICDDEVVDLGIVVAVTHGDS
jgi:hypothetical protein